MIVNFNQYEDNYMNMKSEISSIGKGIILSMAVLITASAFLCAESCGKVGKLEYKADDGCGFKKRTCCEDGNWSDWDGECSAECNSNEYSTEGCGPCEMKDCDGNRHWGKCTSIWELGRYDLIYGKYKAACCASIDAYSEGAHWPLAKIEYEKASRCYNTRFQYYSNIMNTTYFGNGYELPDCPYSFNPLNPYDIQRHTDCFDENTIGSYVYKKLGSLYSGYFCKLAVGKNDYGEPNYEIWECK